MRALLVIIVLLALGAGAAWWMAGRATPPTIQIPQPVKLIGQMGDLHVVVDVPGGKLVGFNVTVQQNDKTLPMFDLADTAAPVTRMGDQFG